MPQQETLKQPVETTVFVSPLVFFEALGEVPLSRAFDAH
jgi:hypothetical protein